MLKVKKFTGIIFNRNLINNNEKKLKEAKRIFKTREIGKELLEEGFNYVIAIFNDIKSKTAETF